MKRAVAKLPFQPLPVLEPKYYPVLLESEAIALIQGDVPETVQAALMRLVLFAYCTHPGRTV